MRRIVVPVMAGVVGVTLTAGAFADDLFPPPWRGGALSVFAEWEWQQAPPNLNFMPPLAGFSVTSGTADPDIGPDGETLYLGFATHAEVDVPTNWAWDPGDGDGGLTPTQPGASIAFNVQNWIDDEPLKLIRIQVAYLGSAPPPTVRYMEGIVEPDFVYDGVPVGGFEGDLYFYEDWEIRPNPDWEQIVLDVPLGITLDQVVIDTISIPGPAVLTALALSAPFVVRKRRG